MKYTFLTTALGFSLLANAQTEPNHAESDSIVTLSNVVIKGYESGRSLLENPVAVGLVRAREMQRFANVSLLPSLNTVPGVRMEERSPGSYRLNIRGSLLRSPFGVRNIKVYWNDMPFTDAGGNTYLNLIDPTTVSSVEVLKGPGGSMYGANTGGVVVLNTDDLPMTTQNGTAENRFRVQLNGGSYGTFGEQAQWKYRNEKFSSTLTQSHVQSDGYRANTKLRKDLVQWNASTRLGEKDKLEWIALYTDLYYKTPGGLTLAQMEADPRQARAIAIDQKAAIYNKTIFTGVSNTYRFNSRWSNVTSISFSHTGFKNPFITNYEKRDESNLGMRTKFVYETKAEQYDFRLVGGAEWLYGYASIDNYGNKAGVPDTVQSKDRLWVRQWFPFVQAEWQLNKKLLIQVGTSTNSYLYHYKRLTGSDPDKKKKKFDEQFLPRLAILYPFTQTMSAFASVSKGFSPATLAEIRASDANINTDLQPEFGWNYETGFRINSKNDRLQGELSAYYFKLEQAIVRRLNVNGDEYFVNAGGTDQKGIEARLSYAIVSDPFASVNLVRLWSGFTYNDYHFKNYILGSTDFSGKELTGVPRTVFVGGIDLATRAGFYLYSNISQTSKLPLNDVNDEYAKAFLLLQAKLGWKKQFSPSFGLELYAGGDNLTNERYSLGNDINALGRRFYNPAATNNYFGGVIINF